MEKKKMAIHIARLFLRIFEFVAIGILALLIIVPLATYFVGFRFFFNTIYGWEAVASSFTLYAFALWPLFLGCIAVIVGTSIYFYKTKGKYDKREAKKAYKIMGKKISLPVVVIFYILLLLEIGDVVLNNTYVGAKVRYRFDINTNRFDMREIDKEVDNSGHNVDLVMIDGLPVYFQSSLEVDGLVKDYRELEPMGKTYYVKFVSSAKVKKMIDLADAKHYQFLDADRIHIFSFFYKDGVCYEPRGDEYNVWRPLN